MGEVEQSSNKPYFANFKVHPIDRVLGTVDETIEESVHQTGTGFINRLQFLKQRLTDGAPAEELHLLIDRLCRLAKHNNELILNMREHISNPEKVPIDKKWRTGDDLYDDTIILHPRDVIWLGEIPPEIQPEDC